MFARRHLEHQPGGGWYRTLVPSGDRAPRRLVMMIGLTLSVAIAGAPWASSTVQLRRRMLTAVDGVDARAVASSPPSLYAVAARSRVDDALFRDLAASGAEVVAYLPFESLAIWAAGDAIVRASSLSSVAFVAPIGSRDRIAPELDRVLPGVASLVEVLTVPAVAAEDVAAKLAQLGVEVLGAGPGARFNRVTARVPADQPGLIESVAAIEGVFSVSPRPFYELLNDTSIWVGQSGLGGSNATPIHDAGIRGEGQVVAVLDTGLDYDMCYFRDPLGAPPTNTGTATASDPTLRKVIAYDFIYSGDNPADPLDYDNHGHGTHVAGSVAGDDLQNLLIHDTGDGMAPAAKLVIQDGGYTGTDNCSDLAGLGCPIVSLLPIFQQAYDQGARIHSNSWGDRENFNPQNTYSSGCIDSDEFMWLNPEFLLVYAAGNSGPNNNTVGSPSVAKNVLSVGAARRGNGADTIAGFSSRGWAGDGRTKPTVTCPGTSITSANSDDDIRTDNCNTVNYSGTSMACPTCAGLGALARQYYMDGFYPSTVATPSDGFTPSAALLKATLINSSLPMLNEAAPISRTQGYGRVTLAETLKLPGSPGVLFVDDNAGFATGEVDTVRYTFDVCSGEPLKVTLVWTDPPSNALALTNLINDLDLVVSGPSGTFLGNEMVAGVSVPGGNPDRLNVEEQVLIAAAAPGVYTVDVSSFSVPMGPQQFALVVTGDLCSVPQCTATAVATPTGATTLCSGATLLLDGSASAVVDCNGAAEYRWLENGVPVGPFVTDPTHTIPVTQAAGSYSYVLEVRCDTDPTCVDALTTAIDVVVEAVPSVVDGLLAVERPTPADVEFSWAPASVGAFRVNSVDDKVDLPARSATGAVARCSTPDAVTLGCFHPSATPVGPVDVLFYSVVGVCSADSSVEGP